MCRRISRSVSSAAEAIAEGERLLGAARPGDPATVVWWEVRERALVLGRSAGPSAVDADAVESAGVPVVRRGSGGGPLLWDAGMLAADVILPREHPLALPDVVEAYRWLGEAVADGLRDMGIDARRVDPDEARAASRERDDTAGRLCFGGLSPHEVVVGDRKVAGLSQARRRTGAILQLGVLVESDPGALADLVASTAGEAAEVAAALARRTVDVRELRPGVGSAEVREALDVAIVRALRAAER